MTGVRFSETMKGRVALRTTDTVAGFASVRAIAATLYADITVDDVDDFTSGETHVAQLRAELVIPVLGVCASATDGTFILFRRGIGLDRRRVREMVYTATFVEGDRTYEMAARKLLQPSWTPWRDTTTAHIVLMVGRTGDDPSAARHAAGCIKISPLGFLVQLANMRGFGEGSTGPQRRRAVLDYVRFFTRGLAKTYLRRARY